MGLDRQYREWHICSSWNSKTAIEAMVIKKNICKQINHTGLNYYSVQTLKNPEVKDKSGFNIFERKSYRCWSQKLISEFKNIRVMKFEEKGILPITLWTMWKDTGSGKENNFVVHPASTLGDWVGDIIPMANCCHHEKFSSCIKSESPQE